MKHSSSLLLAFIVSATSAFSQQSPKSALTLRAGVATLQGETTSDNLFGSIGPEVGIVYSYSMKNEQWAATAEVTHSIVNASLNFTGDGSSSNLETQVAQTYFGVGIRHILNPSINEYKPYAGQFLPYIGIGVGAIKTSNDIDLDTDKLGGYTLHQESTMDFTASAEFGFIIVLSKHWAIDAYTGGRTGGTDSWDGFSGSGDGNDWLIHGGLGLQYHF
ncbi:outer membrane beta-barrel protein [Owenweeksia hongkongensis]|uniref:Outer membrane protein beta-barrel domain-containing protein n=1 Tax=Owenweeksia hongkongensis (strain DSM 17368 / CIP 108786 / JCM 12287 / NRRL B-23963 / UST20020801) TaxID=926562 RepID=G8R6K8_OWEHD|nr:outer membrane beta-barrel protein [Owenweeksia hongkongensis]AEV31151.1 hypothetical protein Oweho_0129 [Owenweeksia hongkongensis DSM 17368]